MLEKSIMNGYGKEENYNCAECILNGANEVYHLALSQEACKVAAAFGGGMGTGRVCGAVVSALMVIGLKNTASVARTSPEVRAMAIAYQEAFEARMGSVDCQVLKETYYKESTQCEHVILKAAALLDEFIIGERANES